MTVDLGTLKTELTTDPTSLGYSALISGGQTQALADALNLRRAGITVPRADVTPMELLEAIAVGDFLSGLSIGAYSWFESLTQFPSVRILKDDGNDSRAMKNIMAILANGSASETRVRALATRNGSRAEKLFGAGVVVTESQVVAALYS